MSNDWWRGFWYGLAWPGFALMIVACLVCAPFGDTGMKAAMWLRRKLEASL